MVLLVALKHFLKPYIHYELTLPLPPLEMLKGFGVGEENPQVTVPVFVNHLDVSRISSEICDRFQAALPSVNVLLIRNHGITVWASSTERAQIYLELADYIFRYMVAARQIELSTTSIKS